jgi:hypothetical protein
MKQVNVATLKVGDRLICKGDKSWSGVVISLGRILVTQRGSEYVHNYRPTDIFDSSIYVIQGKKNRPKDIL